MEIVHTLALRFRGPVNMNNRKQQIQLVKWDNHFLNMLVTKRLKFKFKFKYKIKKSYFLYNFKTKYTVSFIDRKKII